MNPQYHDFLTLKNFILKQRYAVIYGAGSIVGRSFAKILAEKGFGLILIDIKHEKLRQTEIYLQDNVKS